MVVSLAPFVPSRPDVVKRMLEVTKIGPEDIVFDLGCGDGRILIAAVKVFGAKKAIGYEMQSDLYTRTLGDIKQQNLDTKITVIHGDLLKANISEATVITLYLTTSGNERLKPKLMKETNKGTRIVSHDFSITGWHPSVKEEFYGHSIFLYTVPEAFTKKKAPSQRQYYPFKF